MYTCNCKKYASCNSVCNNKGCGRNFERSLEASAMVPMVLVCVYELDTRSRVPFSISYDQIHTYGTCVNMSISWSDDGHENRLQPNDRPRSEPQRQPPCMRRTIPCAARHGRKDQAMKRVQRFAQW